MAVRQGADDVASMQLGNLAHDVRQIDDGDGDDNATTTGARDSQQRGLLQDYHYSNSDAAQETRPRGTSPSGSEAVPTVSSTSHTAINNSLTYLNCLALVVSIQIGSGIFTTPAIVSNHVPTPAAGILAFFLGGILVWTGASCFIELGHVVPRNGGIQEYLCAGYSDFAGFLFSCVWLLIARPCSMAMIALIFAEHVNGIVLPALGLSGGWVADRVVALLAVFGITSVNSLGVKTGATVAIWFLVLKLLIISSIIIAGVVVGLLNKGGHLFESVKEEGRQAMRIIEQSDQMNKSGIWAVFGEYVTAGFAVLWVYGGWEAVGFVAGEMKDPFRDLPRVIKSSMSIVIIGFTLMVTALYMVLPISTIRENETPVVTFGKTLYGPTGSIIYTIAISLSALGSLNGNIFAVGRAVVAASQRDYIPSFLAGENRTRMSVELEQERLRSIMQERWPRWIMWCITRFAKVTGRLRLEQGVPIYAMVLNAFLASVYILMGSFSGLLTFIGITEYLIFVVTVLALFRLRSHPPPVATPSPLTVTPARALIYRVNIVNPIVFCVLSMFLVGRGVVAEPAQGGALIAVLGILWFVWRWKEQTRLPKESEEERARLDFEL